jgi:hypothetical protein
VNEPHFVHGPVTPGTVIAAGFVWLVLLAIALGAAATVAWLMWLVVKALVIAVMATVGGAP